MGHPTQALPYPGRVAHPVETVAQLLAGRLPACGATTVVAIDGPSGSGKSELASALGRRVDARVLRVDELVPGWRGLDQVPRILADELLAPLAVDDVARPVRWDWERDAVGEPMSIAPGGVLVLDGCGAGSRAVRPFLSLLVWLDGPEALRRERAMARDGALYEPWWDVWAEQEHRLFRAEGTAAAADVRFVVG